MGSLRVADSDIDIIYFGIIGKGIKGYLKNYFKLHKYLKKNRPDLIHAHYGLVGLLANFQREIPVITTFHGSDINEKFYLKFSKLANLLSSASIFVSEKMRKKVIVRPNSYTIPCAVDLSVFFPVDKEEAQRKMSMNEDFFNILFSSAFHIGVKNYELARKACEIVGKKTGRKVNLIELAGYSRNEVNFLLNAVDCALLTSFNEGSPQFVKEALASSCPIVSTDVGDVRELFNEIDGCYLSSFEPDDVATKIELAVDFSKNIGRTNGRNQIINFGLDSESISKKVIGVYQKVLNKLE